MYSFYVKGCLQTAAAGPLNLRAALLPPRQCLRAKVSDVKIGGGFHDNDGIFFFKLCRGTKSFEKTEGDVIVKTVLECVVTVLRREAAPAAARDFQAQHPLAFFPTRRTLFKKKKKVNRCMLSSLIIYVTTL